MVGQTIYVAYLQQTAVEVASGGEPAAATEGGATAEVTAEPSNPILPVMPEVWWGLGTFLALWALMKFVLLKPVKDGMDERDEKVRGDLARAEEAEQQATAALADYHSGLSSAKAEATRIIEDARAQGEATRKELVGGAEAEVSAQKAAAADEVATAKAAAKAQISASVATIATEAAGVVIQKPLDVEAQRAAVDEFLSRPGAG